jgi:hypothetical protein
MNRTRTDAREAVSRRALTMRRRQELKRTLGFKGANVRRPTVVARIRVELTQ